jgi:superfamily II DNA helicase RecQ
LGTLSICSDVGIDALVSRIKSKVTYYTPEDRGIVFVPAVDLFVEIKGMLSISSISCVTYSGQQEDSENVASFAAWKDGEVKLMVATSAFGIGIDHGY